MGPETSEVYVNGTFLLVYIFFDKISYFTVNSLSTLHSSSFIRFSIFVRVMFILICVFCTDNATIHQSGS